MTRAAAVTASAIVSCVAALLAPSGATAAEDTTPPALTVPVLASFVSGSTIGPMAADPDTGDLMETRDIVMRARWSATDVGGICGYSTQAVYAGFEPGPWSAWGSQTSLTVPVTDYDSQQGGGSFKLTGYNVRARDCAGNVSEQFARYAPGVFQETGASYGFSGVTSAFAGSWAVSRCACWSGGTARRTSQAGARASFTFDYAVGHPVALVMEKAPDRGHARIYVDGTLRATVDTFAATPQHRSVVWLGRLPAGRHVVSVVNLATAGRPRIDVDAVMVSGLSA
jgi:hypothetical protein